MHKLIKKSLIFLILLCLGHSNTYAEARNGLFGSTEFKSTELSAFKKWADQRIRYNNELRHSSRAPSKMGQNCRRTKAFKCVDQAWQDMINSLKGQPEKVTLETVNKYMNESSYITDMVNWHQEDYWATINQFLGKDGDCEDYAIAKYYSLKELGFKVDQMRIVIVHDNNLNIAHAILAVYLKDKIWILDNQVSHIISSDQVVHYRPLYSINENAWWLHKIT
ncbi:MAG: transglutaminase-like cysteine peptidase [Alphaproteobacteria bacterium]|nr:transglutaminase-like cysteine peptidase [Alphaproteobacteria bacterium]HPF45789.1 transglutaminase-like cysteine peptidase [Emcibacteraceae bacterium]HRW28695.1 transglutaminase-like cysteine peptidase [Emcibacteraceae bacterium]